MAFTVFSCAFFTGFVNKICVSTSLLCTSDHYTTETEINVDWLNVSGFCVSLLSTHCAERQGAEEEGVSTGSYCFHYKQKT